MNEVIIIFVNKEKRTIKEVYGITVTGHQLVIATNDKYEEIKYIYIDMEQISVMCVN